MSKMRRTGKRIISMALTIALMLSCVPMDSYATEEKVQDETVIQTYVPDVDLPSNEELFAGYVEQMFYGNAGISMFGVGNRTAGSRLSGDEALAYNALKTYIPSIANGQRGLAKIVLGLEYAENPVDQVVEFQKNYQDFDLDAVYNALLTDFPYEFYWHDKTDGVKVKIVGENQYKYQLQFKFAVVNAYRADDYSQDAPTVNTEKTEKASVAATNAQSVVSNNVSLSDHAKLVAYKNYICDNVEYDQNAANGGYPGGYGDPWQLIYVFDGDPETNVVCEGYSKAFQYLCDLSSFSEDISCYSVTGTAGGPHMWNIVTMEDGANYLVDVTNTETVGKNGELFLAGTNGSINEGYVFSDILVLGEGNQLVPISYFYDSETISTWGEDDDSILKLAETNYTVRTDISNAAVTIEKESFTYTGEAIAPTVVVSLNGTPLNGESDYTVEYANNKNAGQATIIVTGIDNYRGTVTKTFEIVPVTPEITWEIDNQSVVYDGNIPKMTAPTVTLLNDDTYTGNISYEYRTNEDGEYVSGLPINAGVYYVKATIPETGNYTYAETEDIVLTISKAAAKPLDDITSSVIFNSGELMVEEIAKGMPEDAGALTFSLGAVTGSGLSEITIEGNQLTANIEGAVVGNTVEIPITISSVNYEDSVVTINVSFVSEILTEDDVIVTVNDAVYNGQEQKQTVTIQLKDTNENLTQDTDFEVEYPDDCKNVGTKDITIQFKGSYAGELNTSYVIEQCSVSNATVQVSADENIVYTGEAVTPEFDVKVGNVLLVKDTDYTVEYLGEDDSHIDVGTVNVKITGIHNYKDTIDASYEIEQAPLNDAKVTVNGSFQYSGTAIQPSDFIVVWNGKILTAGTDYEFAGYKNNINAGEAILTVTGCGNFKDTAEGTFTIAKAPVKVSGIDAQIAFGTESYDVSKMFHIDTNAGKASYAVIDGLDIATLDDKTLTVKKAGTVTIKVTTEEADNYLSGEATAILTVQTANLTDAEIIFSEDSFVYDGEEKKPSVTVKLNQTELVAEKDYSVEYKNHVDAGQAVVIITALENGNYTGTKEGNFTILQAAGTVALAQSYATNYNFTNSSVPEPEKTDVNTNIYNPVITFTWYEGTAVEESKKLIGAPSAIGSYTLKIDVAETKNYTEASATVVVTITAFETKEKATLADTNKGTDNWYRGDVTVLAPDGYKISATMNGTYADSFVVTDDSDSDGTETIYFLKQNDTEYISESKTITVKRDSAAPSGKITIAANSFKEFLNEVTFGLFFKKTIDVAIDGTDALSGVDKVYYQKVVSATNYVPNGTWTEGKQLSVNPNEKFVVYAKICDKAGNTTIVNSNGVVVYTDATADTKTIEYTKFSAADLNAKVNLNGNTIHTVSVGSKSLTKDVDYTVNHDVITFKNSCLDALAAGNHEVKISYNPFGETYVTAEGNEAPAVTTISLTIYLAEGVITNISDLSKEYDGKPVGIPIITTDSKGSVRVEYKLRDAADSTYTTTAPKNAGEYVVRVNVSEDSNYEKMTAEKEFIISKAAATSKIDISVTSQAAGKNVVITVYTYNIDEISATPASMRVKITANDETTAQTLTKKSEGVYTGSYTIPKGLTERTEIQFSVDDASDKNFAIAADKETIKVSEQEKTPLPAPESEGGKNYKLEKEDGIFDVPTVFSNNEKLNTEEKIENEIKEAVKEKYKDIPAGNMKVYDVELMYREGGNGEWKEADANNFPNNGKLKIILPYPKGTGKNTHTFVVTHMFTTTAVGKTPGDVEYPVVKNTDAGIEFEVTGLSPIAVGWKEIPKVSSGNSSSSGNKSIAMFADTDKYISVDTSIDNSLIEEAKNELAKLIGDSYGLYRVALAADLEAELTERTKIKILIDGITKADASIILHKGPNGWETVPTEEGEGYVIGWFKSLSPVVVFVDKDGAVEQAKLLHTAETSRKPASSGKVAPTGDEAQPMWFLLLAVIALTGIGGITYYNKKKGNKKE